MTSFQQNWYDLEIDKNSCKHLTRSNNSWTWEAIAFPLIIIWLDGSALPLLEEMLGKMLIPPVFLPINWFNWTKSASLVPISITDWLQKALKHSQKYILIGFQYVSGCYTYQNSGMRGRSLESIELISKANSAYSTSFVNRSWRSTGVPWISPICCTQGHMSTCQSSKSRPHNMLNI